MRFKHIITIVTVLAITFGIFKATTFDYTGHRLMNQLETAEANADSLREDFYNIIDKAKFNDFIEAKVKELEIEMIVKEYIESKEEIVIIPETLEDLRHQARIEVMKVFVEQVLERNNLNLSDFYQVLGKNSKLPAIDTLQGVIKEKAQKLVRLLKANGVEAFVFEGYRTPERQHELFNKRPVVTYADSWESIHQTGQAFDIVCLVDGKPNWSQCDWAKIGKLGKSLGLIWGGDWKMVDKPHFELPKKQWSQKAIIKQYVCKRTYGVINNLGNDLSELCNQSDLFYEIGREAGVHPYLLVAIAVADTSLGKNLKTPFNLGNVGNFDHGTDGETCIGRTDGGCTRSHGDYEEGIRAIATSTALRKNEQAGALSPACNIKGVWYAHSEFNWWNNVSSVLAELGGAGYGNCYFKYQLTHKDYENKR